MTEQLRNPEEIEQLRREKEILEKEGFEFNGDSWIKKANEELRKQFNKRIKSLKLDGQAREELFNKFIACWDRGFRCFYCNRRMDLKFENEYSWTIEHFIPRAKGGKDEAENIEFVCRACNFLKGEMNPEQYINNHKRLKLRKQKMEYFQARKATEKDEPIREAYKDIFERVNVKKEGAIK